jgi:hypothetical protein
LFHLLGSLLTLVLAGGAGILGYWKARQFTMNKLRYVDAIHKTIAPVLAGIAAVLIATPVAWLVPFITAFTVLLFGGGVALGVAAGARDVRRRIGAG